MLNDFASSPRASKRRKINAPFPNTSISEDHDSTYASREDSLAEASSPEMSNATNLTTRSAKKSRAEQSGHVYEKSNAGASRTPRKGMMAQRQDEEAIRHTGTSTEHNDGTGLETSEPQGHNDSNEERELETEETQPRSSGRERRRPRRFSDTPQKPTIQKKSSSTGKKTQKGAAETKVQAVTKPRGILSPSKRKSSGPRKSVVFDGDEKDIEQQLGFKDISASTKKRKTKTVAGVSEPVHAELKAQNSEPQLPDVEYDEIQAQITHDLEITESIHDDDPAAIQLQLELESGETQYEEHPELLKIKCEVLARMLSSKPPPLSHLESQYDIVHTLLSATITSGESNSLLLLGARGVGKTLLLDMALNDLASKHQQDFHVVRLNGFIQTDDRLALREIWRQLGREMQISEDETGEVSNYADTMASLLSLLSHPEEIEPESMDVDGVPRISKSVVFILDEFDLFTTHPRQTLLYNLFDIAQARKAPIAVIGCSARTDVIECLEKRVKSRYSHRWAHVPAMKNIAAFEDAVRANLSVNDDGSKAVGKLTQDIEWRARWNEYIKNEFLPSDTVQMMIKQTFYSSKSVPELLTSIYPLIATSQLSLSTDKSNSISDVQSLTQLPSLLTFLPTLPTLHISLITAAARLETIHSLQAINFNLVYTHYTELIARSRLKQTASGAVAVGGAGLRQWDRAIASSAWEELARYGLVVPVTGVAKEGELTGGGEGQSSRMHTVDVTLAEVEWAVKEKWSKKGSMEGTGEVIGKWCREI